jgi:hypothetical protein
MESLLQQLDQEYALLMAVVPKPEVAVKIPRALCALIKAMPGATAPKSQVRDRVRGALYDDSAHCLVVKTIIGGILFPGKYDLDKLDDIVNSFY